MRISEPPAAVVTDSALAFQEEILLPRLDGVYLYSWTTEHVDGTVSFDKIVLRYTVSGGGTHATLESSEDGGETFTLDYEGALLRGMRPTNVYLLTSGFLGTLNDDALLESHFIGTYTVSEDLNGFRNDGQFDLRMLAVRNLRAEPEQFDPDHGEFTTLRGDVVALPRATSLFPAGWQPVSNVSWRITIDSSGQPVKTFAGVSPVSGPDTSGRVAQIEQVWSGDQDASSGPVEDGPYRILARALGPLDAGNALTRFQVLPVHVGPALEIELTAQPEKFDPARETTVLSGAIVAQGFLPTNLHSQAVVKDPDGQVVRTFPVRQGSLIREVWDGRDDRGEFAGYGTFTWEVEATADEGSGRASTEVRSLPPLPEITRIEFESTVPLADDDGNKLSPIYYEKQNGEVVQDNPVALLPRSGAAASSGTSSGIRARCSEAASLFYGMALTLELPGTLLDPAGASYDIRVRDEDGSVIPSTSVFFPIGENQQVMTLVLELEPVVHEIDFLKLDVKHVTEADFVNDPIVVGKPVYISPCYPSKAPFEVEGDKVPTLGLMDISHHLAEGAGSEEEILTRIVRNMDSFLTSKGFVYNVESSHVSGWKRTQTEGSLEPVGFHYFWLMEHFTNPNAPFEGNCSDISNLAALCCAATGVSVRLQVIGYPSDKRQRFVTHPARAPGVAMRLKVVTLSTGKVSWENYSPPQFLNLAFNYHQTLTFNSKIWDPALIFQAAGVPQSQDKLVYRDQILVQSILGAQPQIQNEIEMKLEY